jgi:WD40 repeat protein
VIASENGRILVWNVSSKEVRFWKPDLPAGLELEIEDTPLVRDNLAVAKLKDKTFWIIARRGGWRKTDSKYKTKTSGSGVVQVLDENGKVLYTRTTERGLTSVAVSPNGRWFATGEQDVVLFHKVDDRARPIQGLLLRDELVQPKVLRLPDEPSAVYLWETETGKLLAILEGHQKGVNKVAVSPNGDWVAAAGEDGTIRLWKVPETIR